MLGPSGGGHKFPSAAGIGRIDGILYWAGGVTADRHHVGRKESMCTHAGNGGGAGGRG